MPSTSQQNPPSSPTVARTSWRALVGPLVALVLLIILGRIVGTRWPEIEAAVEGAGLAGWALFVGAAAFLTACCFPLAGLDLH